MWKTIQATMAVFFCCSLVLAGGGLDGFLANLNVQARADLSEFASRLGTQFGIPGSQVSAVIGTVKEPADAFMVFQLGRMTNQPPERVMSAYQSHQGKGWGVIAKELGIKPGSPEFHALKRGDFQLTGTPGEGYGKSHDKGKGKGQGKGEGHNQ